MFFLFYKSFHFINGEKGNVPKFLLANKIRINSSNIGKVFSSATSVLMSSLKSCYSKAICVWVPNTRVKTKSVLIDYSYFCFTTETKKNGNYRSILLLFSIKIYIYFFKLPNIKKSIQFCCLHTKNSIVKQSKLDQFYPISFLGYINSE